MQQSIAGAHQAVKRRKTGETAVRAKTVRRKRKNSALSWGLHSFQIRLDLDLAACSSSSTIKDLESPQARNESWISRSLVWLRAHCLSLALAMKMYSTSSLMVLLVSECGPLEAPGALSSQK